MYSDDSAASQEIEIRYQGMLTDEDNSKVEESNKHPLAGLGELMDI